MIGGNEGGDIKGNKVDAQIRGEIRAPYHEDGEDELMTGSDRRDE